MPDGGFDAPSSTMKSLLPRGIRALVAAHRARDRMDVLLARRAFLAGEFGEDDARVQDLGRQIKRIGHGANIPLNGWYRAWLVTQWPFDLVIELARFSHHKENGYYCCRGQSLAVWIDALYWRLGLHDGRSNNARRHLELILCRHQRERAIEAFRR